MVLSMRFHRKIIIIFIRCAHLIRNTQAPAERNPEWERKEKTVKRLCIRPHGFKSRLERIDLCVSVIFIDDALHIPQKLFQGFHVFIYPVKDQISFINSQSAFGIFNRLFGGHTASFEHVLKYILDIF